MGRTCLVTPRIAPRPFAAGHSLTYTALLPDTDANMNINRRGSLRLKGYDYAQAGAYFVTICTHDRACLLGEAVGEEVRLSDAGSIVQEAWQALPGRFSGMELDAFVVMPNHVHGIATFVGAGLALPGEKGAASSAPTLGDVVRAFKSLSAIHVNRLLRRSGPLWQRNYYEHVIRNERELDKIREYIATNPLRWALDRENPQRTGCSAEEDALFDLNKRQTP
jgi:putative transposase